MQRPGAVTAIAIVEIVLSSIGIVYKLFFTWGVNSVSDVAGAMRSSLAEAAAESGDAEAIAAIEGIANAGGTLTWMLYLGLAISIISLIGGIMMLKGASWTPFVAIGTWAIGIVIGVLGGSFSIWLLIPILFVAIYSYLLFQPDAKAYFSGAN